MTPKSKELINDLLDEAINSYGNWWEDKNMNELQVAKIEFNNLKPNKDV